MAAQQRHPDAVIADMVGVGTSTVLDDDRVEDRLRLVRPAVCDTMAGEALAASNWQEAAPDHWRALWEAELKVLPTHTESRLWLVSGLLLPLWDRLPTAACACERSPPTRANASSAGCSGPRKRGRCASPWGSAGTWTSPRRRSARSSSTADRSASLRTWPEKPRRYPWTGPGLSNRQWRRCAAFLSGMLACNALLRERSQEVPKGRLPTDRQTPSCRASRTTPQDGPAKGGR